MSQSPNPKSKITNSSLDSTAVEPLYRQLYQQLRGQILAGQLAPGTAVPPSRQLAVACGVSRHTVTAALAQLHAEGYLSSRRGAGTFVSDPLPTLTHQPTTPPHFSPWGQRLVAQTAPTSTTPPRPEIDFGFGRTFATAFPYDVWRRLLGRYLSTDDALLARYGSAGGFAPLRTAVASYLTHLRGVNASAEQIIIVNGVQQALDILARLLVSAGDELLIETPSYPNAFKLFRVYGADLRPLPVDEHGFNPALIPADSTARLVFVTPSNQFPHGGAMPLARRLALLDWARRQNALIIEDDYDGELRYDGHPLASLQGLDGDGRVIYLGSFSKVLFPALRLGYVVLPPPLLEPFLQAKQLIDRGTPTLTQAAVADFITEGHFERHLRRLRQEYGERRRVLAEALRAQLGTAVRFSGDAAGLQLLVYLPPHCDEQEVVRAAAEQGVGVYPGTPYHLQHPPPPSLLLGFSGLAPAEIVEGVARLAKVLGAERNGDAKELLT